MTKLLCVTTTARNRLSKVRELALSYIWYFSRRYFLAEKKTTHPTHPMTVSFPRTVWELTPRAQLNEPPNPVHQFRGLLWNQPPCCYRGASSPTHSPPRDYYLRYAARYREYVEIKKTDFPAAPHHYTRL